MWSLSAGPFPFLEVSVVSRVALLLLDIYLWVRQIRRFGETAPSLRVAALVSQREFLRAQAYGRSRATFKLFDTAFHGILSVLFTVSFVRPQLWTQARRIACAAGYFESELAQPVIFFLVLGAVRFLLGLPAAVFSTFVIEARFGFNRTSPRTFVRDTLLKASLALVIGVPAVAVLHSALPYIAAKSLAEFAPTLLGVISGVLFDMFVLPSDIDPLFNTYVPLPDGALRDKVAALAADVRFPLHSVYVVDWSRRSSHSNAYCTGICSKICIYDSLLEHAKGRDEQVVAVFCHELGHWACSHNLLRLLLSNALYVVFCTLYAVTAGNPHLFRSFGYVDGTMPPIIGLVLFLEILTPFHSVLVPLCNVLSRRFEYQADKFVKDRGFGEPLARALVAMHVNNLDIMAPDPLFTMWKCSHPTLLERLDALDMDVDVLVGSGEGKKEE